jgi:hypothetical protein
MLVLWLSCVNLCWNAARIVLTTNDDPKSTVKSVGDPGDVSSRLPVLNGFVEDLFLSSIGFRHPEY